MNAKKIWFWVGTLVVGALGSGLWSLIEAPFWKIANWFLTATTLGIQSIRDNVYARAALGLHELPSLYLFMMLSIFMVTIPITFALLPTMRSRIDKLINGSNSNETHTLRLLRAKRLLYITSLVGALLGASFLVNAMMVNQENLIASYYRQYVSIIHPYISESQYLRLNSAFANMKSKTEYDQLMSQMRKIAEEHEVVLPEIHTW